MPNIRVGILGLRRGFTHLRNFLHADGADVIGACDRVQANRDRGTALVTESGSQTHIVEEFNDLLAMKPDAIVVASNGSLHVEHSIQAMEAGCAVLCEVPGAFTPEESWRLRECVQRTGAFYMLAENTCFWDFFRYFRKWIVEEQFGSISIAEGEYLHYLPNTMLTPQGTVPPSRVKTEGITDAVPSWRAAMPPIQYLTHDLGPLLEILDDRAVSVTCQSAASRSEEAPLRSDGQIALFQTAKGHLIKIMVTLNTRRPEEHRYRLFGTLGSAEWFRYEGYARRFTRTMETKEGWEVFPVGFAARDDDTTTGHGGADLKVATAFTNALSEGRPSPIDVYRAMEYHLPGMLAHRSAELGGAPVAIPDVRTTPFEGTDFWNVVGLPDVDPPRSLYNETR